MADKHRSAAGLLSTSEDPVHRLFVCVLLLSLLQRLIFLPTEFLPLFLLLIKLDVFPPLLV